MNQNREMRKRSYVGILYMIKVAFGISEEEWIYQFGLALAAW